METVLYVIIAVALVIMAGGVVYAALATRDAVKRLEASHVLLRMRSETNARANERIEAAAAVVATDLADAHTRADEIVGAHGAAADAFSQSAPPVNAGEAADAFMTTKPEDTPTG